MHAELQAAAIPNHNNEKFVDLDTIAIVLLIILVLLIAGHYLWSVGWALYKKPIIGSKALIEKAELLYRISIQITWER